TLHNTVVAGNFQGMGSARSDVQGDVDPGSSYNLVGDGTGLASLSDGQNNRVGSASSPLDPLLGPLQDNGRPTLTHPPLPGTPLATAGTADGAPDADQRGQPRTGARDIGAVEFLGVVAVSTPVPDGAYRPGDVFPVMVTFSDPVTVSPGLPVFALP